MSLRETTSSQYATRSKLLIFGLMAIASNFRAPIVGVAPVLAMIQSTFDLTAAQAGVLTTLPLLAFAIISPVSPLLAREYGLERLLFAALAFIACGVVVRSLGPVWCLYIGTAIIGSGIAVGNVLLPSLTKRDFPHNTPALTGACAVATALTSAIASATVVPLAHLSSLDWPGALAAIVVIPLFAIALWLPQLGQHTAPANTTSSPHGGSIWSSALAWHVTMFMGVNSFVYYILVSWLSSILTAAGFSASEGGTMQGLMQIAAVLPGFLLAPLVNRAKDQSGIAMGTAALMAVGLLGLLLVPAWSAVWVMCFGVGSGAGVILSLMFMSLRVGNPQQAASLSGMAQCVGYLLAAAGPPLMGKVHDILNGWTVPLWACLVLSIVMAAFGGLAGRSLQIGAAHSAKAA